MFSVRCRGRDDEEVPDFIPEYSYITFDALHYCIVIVW